MLQDNYREERQQVNDFCDARGFGEVLTVTQAAKYLGRCRQTTRKMLRFSASRPPTITRAQLARQITEMNTYRASEDY